jgi:hypothetical protein
MATQEAADPQYALQVMENRLVLLRSRAEVLFRSAEYPDRPRGPNLAGIDRTAPR